MTLHDDAAYAALAARDARFDGRLFVGVSSTGIYCRPVCRVRLPLRRNCSFFANAASAEQAGFRPCLRCRPELAPGLSLVDSPQALAQQAARMIDTAVRNGSAAPLPALAERLGVTDRHLRRIFHQAHGVTPVGYLGTQRLLLAKQLLTDTALPVTQVALASGFRSLRRFNAAFAESYRLNPSALRREGAAPANAQARAAEAISLRLPYRPPYDQAGVLRFLARRALQGVESFDGGCWRRLLAVQQQGRWHAGWLSLEFDAHAPQVQLKLSAALVPVLGAVVQRVRHALDLDAEPALIDPVLQAAPLAAPLDAPAGLRVPGALCGFETAVRIVLGQQVSVAAARTLAQRLVQRFGAPLQSPWSALQRLFPSPQALAEADAADIGRLGIVRQRVAALQSLARAVHAGQIDLQGGQPLAPTLAALGELGGIGEWTLQLVAMRVLGWPDAFAATDVAVLKALGTRSPAQALAQAEAWRPWRAYAVMALWQTLEKDT